MFSVGNVVEAEMQAGRPHYGSVPVSWAGAMWIILGLTGPLLMGVPRKLLGNIIGRNGSLVLDPV